MSARGGLPHHSRYPRFWFLRTLWAILREGIPYFFSRARWRRA